MEKPKWAIYYEIKAENPDLKLSLSKFYKLCPKYFKKPKKMTDMCRICVDGKKAEKNLLLLKSNISRSNK